MMNVEQKRIFVSDLAARLYMMGLSGDEAAVIAYSWFETLEEEWHTMTPAQQVERVREVLANRR